MTTSQAIAITGAAGFIGSHAAKALSRSGLSIRALSGPLSEKRSVRPLPSQQVLTGDITDPDLLDALLQDAATVVHAAGPPSVMESFRDPQEFHRVHSFGTQALLEACVRRGVRRIVHISSAEVYGTGQAGSVSEAQPLLATSPYAAAKIAAEQAVQAFCVAGQIEAFILRPFSVYGPGMSGESVVAQVLRQARTQRVIEIRDSRPERDFCYVTDVAAAISSACFAPLNGIATVNLGTGIATSIGTLARIAGELTGVAEIRDGASPRIHEATHVRLVADAAASARLLQWSASTSLRDGLLNTLAASHSS